MKRSLLAVLFSLPLLLAAQDTLHVQTLTFDSITTRRGWWVFPDTTHSFRKVLMHQTLKCDPATTWDQYDCGEWDYLTYLFAYDHTGVYDSTAMQHPWFLVGNSAPDSVSTTPDLKYDSLFHWSPRMTIDSVWSETEHLVGAGDALDGMTFFTPVLPEGSRSQFLYTAAELSAAGVVGGTPIDRLRFTVTAPGSFDGCVVRMKNTVAASITAFDDAGLTTVFEGEAFSFNGTLDLALPFTWDGVSNLLVDLSFVHAPFPPTEVEATNVAAGLGVQQVGGEGRVRTNNDFIGVETGGFSALNDQVTILFRTWGDPVLPINCTVLDGRDALNRRQVNIHLPWSDGRVYWDAGGDAAGYDRIDKLAVAADYEGQWTNWAFTKNTATGSMKIYKNGVLWHSGTGKTKPMAGIVRFNIGSDAARNLQYPGLIDDVVILNTELDLTEIQSLVDHTMDALDPNWSNVIYAFDFDRPAELGPMMPNYGSGAGAAWLMGTVHPEFEVPTALRRRSGPVSVRPDISFVQGTYTSVTDSVLSHRLLPHGHLTREIFQVSGNSAVAVDTIAAFDTDPVIATYPDSTTNHAVSGTTYFNDSLDYFGVPFELVNNRELGRYITPYGIGLSLGPNGFRWTYDVTDYQYLLHDSVELSAGNTQELIDLDFEMIEGTAPRELVRHQLPWGPQRSYSYGVMSNDTQLSPVTVGLDPAAAQWTLRSRFTGHGDATSIPGVQGCCEFKDNTHYLDAFGSEIDSWHVWQTNDCALNPVYPQGGTWIHAREGWCPGDAVKDHFTELTPYVIGDSIEIDYRITPVPAGNPGMAAGNYVVNMDLLEFTAPAHALDAEIYTVKRPTDIGLHSRENPICADAVVTLRNAGAQDLTSVTFTYGVTGGVNETYTWNGLLKHMESEDVTLPIGSGWFWQGDSAHLFQVTVSAPNGGTDAYPDNDSYATHFVLPPVYANNFILFYKTNNRPFENTVTIRDIWGTAVYEKDWTGLSNNTNYYDTLALTSGCYSLELFDESNDGLYYWADPPQGNGAFRFKNIGGAVFKTFEKEFGRSIHFAFAISDVVGINEPEHTAGVSAYPDPSEGNFTLQFAGMEGPGTLEILDGRGELVRTMDLEFMDGSRVEVDLTGHADGIYLARATCQGRVAMVRLVKQ